MKFHWMVVAAAWVVAGTAGADELKTGIAGALGGAAGAAIGQSVGGKNGAVIGGAVGGASGAAVGSDSRNKTGAVIGGAVGGATGAAVGQRTGVGAVVGAGVGAGAGAAIGDALGGDGRSGQPAMRVVGGGYGGERYYDDGKGCNGKKVGHHKHGKYNKHGC